jgi:non-heme chloroperoxidase
MGSGPTGVAAVSSAAGAPGIVVDARTTQLAHRTHPHQSIPSLHAHALAHSVPVNPTVPSASGVHGQTYFDPHALSDPAQASAGSVFVTNDGVRLYYEEKGAGHPLVLIHGWSGSSKVFVRNFDSLATSFRVVRFDLRGHGDSETPGQGFHVARFAVDLLNLLDHLQLERVALLGCSLGCAVIWSYVELFGTQRISAAMFIDQSPWQLYADDGSWRLGSDGLFSASALAHLSASLTYDPRGCHLRTVKACLTRSPTDEEEEFFVSEGLKAQGWFLAKLMADHNNNDWRATLQCVTCPALVIAGKQSKIFPWAGVAYAAEVMPNAKLITFDEGSHWLYYEEADRFNSVVTAFLQSIVSATS